MLIFCDLINQCFLTRIFRFADKKSKILIVVHKWDNSRQKLQKLLTFAIWEYLLIQCFLESKTQHGQSTFWYYWESTLDKIQSVLQKVTVLVYWNMSPCCRVWWVIVLLFTSSINVCKTLYMIAKLQNCHLFHHPLIMFLSRKNWDS